MRVVLSAASFFPRSFGGGEVYVYRVAKELLRRGHTATVVTAIPWPGGTSPHRLDRYEYENVPVAAVSINPSAADQVELHTGYGAAVKGALLEILGELRPDLVHANGLKAAFTSVCRELGTRQVVTVHHAGIACPAGTLVRPDGATCDYAMSNDVCVRCASTSRRPRWHAGDVLGRMPPWISGPIGRSLNARRELSYLERGLIYPWLVEQSILAKRLVLRDAELIIAPSEAMKALLVRNGRSADSVLVVPHGVEPLRTAPLEPFEGRPVRLGYVGRIDPLKGLHVILDALERTSLASSCELHVFGAARHPWDDAYRARAMERYRGNAQVIVHGLVNQQELSSVYSQFDILVVPSLLPEAFGLVVLEAFSAGRPVIVSSSGGLPELVRNGVDGIVLEACTPPALAEVLQRILENPGTIATMASRIPRVRTTAEHVDELLKAYDRASGRSP